MNPKCNRDDILFLSSDIHACMKHSVTMVFLANYLCDETFFRFQLPYLYCITVPFRRWHTFLATSAKESDNRINVCFLWNQICPSISRWLLAMPSFLSHFLLLVQYLPGHSYWGLSIVQLFALRSGIKYIAIRWSSLVCSVLHHIYTKFSQ